MDGEIHGGRAKSEVKYRKACFKIITGAVVLAGMAENM